MKEGEPKWLLHPLMGHESACESDLARYSTIDPGGSSLCISPYPFGGSIGGGNGTEENSSSSCCCSCDEHVGGAMAGGKGNSMTGGCNGEQGNQSSSPTTTMSSSSSPPKALILALFASCREIGIAVADCCDDA